MSKALIIILCILLSTSLLFGYLSYRFYASKAEAVGQLKTARETILEQENTLKLRDLSCKIDNKVVGEYQTEKSVQQDKTTSTLSKIDTLPNIPKKPPTISEGVVTNESNQVDIDSRLPDDLVKLLQSSCVQDTGESCVSP